MKNISTYARLAEGAYNDELTEIGMSTHFIQDEITDTQVHVLVNDKVQYVVFRGTEASYKDIKTDLSFKMYYGMHKGFYEGYKSVTKRVNNLLEFRRPTIFIGHSLGGALAILAGSFHPSDNKMIVTFGAPRVFNDTQAVEYNHGDICGGSDTNGKLTYRFENKCDPVPYLPPYSMGYRHVGKTIYLNNSEPEENPSSFGPFWSFCMSSTRTKLNAHKMQSYIQKINKFY